MKNDNQSVESNIDNYKSFFLSNRCQDVQRTMEMYFEYVDTFYLTTWIRLASSIMNNECYQMTNPVLHKITAWKCP